MYYKQDIILNLSKQFFCSLTKSRKRCCDIMMCAMSFFARLFLYSCDTTKVFH